MMGTGRRANQQREMGRAREMPRRLMPCSSASRRRCSMTGNLAAIRAEEGGGSSVWFQDGGVTDDEADEAETEKRETQSLASVSRVASPCKTRQFLLFQWHSR